MDSPRDWSAFRRSLTAFVRRRVSSPEDAEDIVQEVMLRLHHRGAEVPKEKVGPWLHRVAANAVIDHYRARGARGIAVELPDELAANERDHHSLDADIAGCLQPLLAGLPAKYIEAVRLADLDHLPQAEVAARLGLGASGAKSRIQRGRALLRGELDRCCRVEFDRRGNVVDARSIGPGPKCGVR